MGLKYFLELGVGPDDPADNVFIIQGFDVSVQIPNYPNVKVFRRTNDCYDFGAFGAAIEWLGGIDALKGKYDYFFFTNPTRDVKSHDW